MNTRYDRMHICSIYFLLLFLGSTSACEQDENIITEEQNEIITTEFKSSPWLVQLQGADIQEIVESGFPLAVFDYSKDGSDATRYTWEDVQELHEASIIPISYISIGEAENYRFYWDHEWVEALDQNSFTDKAPVWLGHSNPNWIGNYKVRYWYPDWKENILIPYLDKIISQGFRGIYLDIIDAYFYWYNPANYGGDNKETQLAGDPVDNLELACERMIELVVWIADYCRTNSPFGEDFLIFPQNGETIMDYDHNDSYMDAIDGLGVESVWYYETSPKGSEAVNFRLQYLRRIIENDKLILAVDYVDDGSGLTGANLERIEDFIVKCNTEKFRYYVARSDRKLDMINTIEGIQP